MSVREMWDVRNELNARSRSIQSLRGQVRVYKRAISRIGDERREERSLFEDEINRLSSIIKSNERTIANHKRLLNDEKKRSSSNASLAKSAQGQVAKFQSGAYVDDVVTAASNIERKNTAQQPLMTAAAMRFNSYFDEFGKKIAIHKDEGLVVMGWLSFPEEHVTDNFEPTFRMPYIYPGQGLSFTREQFNPSGVKVGSDDVWRLVSIFYTSLAIAVMNSTTLIDVATGVFNERFDAAVESGEDITELCEAYNAATKVWRAYASRQAGDIRQLVWPIMNQMIEMANTYPGFFWGYDDNEVERGRYHAPVALMTGFAEALHGSGPDWFLPKTKMQTFIREYGKGTQAFEEAFENGLLNINHVWADCFGELFGKARGFVGAENVEAMGLTMQIKSIIKQS